MGKRTLWTGIIAGAVVGGIATLFHDETREYVKETVDKAYEQTDYYIKHPDVGVNKVKQTVVSVNQLVSDNTDNAMNALSQVEGTLQKFIK